MGSSDKGELYQLKMDSVKGAEIPTQLLNIGYFYVAGKQVIRFLHLSKKQIHKILTEDQFPKHSSVVITEKSVKDKGKGKGIHEEITRQGDLIEYCYYDNSASMNFYETFVWKKRTGMILYRRGYAAELEAITLWMDGYVDDPHEFSLQ